MKCNLYVSLFVQNKVSILLFYHEVVNSDTFFTLAYIFCFCRRNSTAENDRRRIGISEKSPIPFWLFELYNKYNVPIHNFYPPNDSFQNQ